MIAEMKKAYIIGLIQHTDSILGSLQDLGVMDLVRVSREESKDLESQRRALRRLKVTMGSLSQVSVGREAHNKGLSAEEVVERTQRIGERRARISDEIGTARRQIARLELWGEFDPERIKRLAEDEHIYVQLFELSSTRYEALEIPRGAETHILLQEGDKLLLATVSTQPLSLGIEEFPLPRAELSRERECLRALEGEDRELAEELEGLRAYLKPLKASWEAGTDRYQFDEAKTLLVRSGELFYLEGWVPADREEELHRRGEEVGFLAHTQKPKWHEFPPSLLDNESVGAVGESLVSIYDTPNYKDIDPSSPVFFFFALFFGMIVGDGGYGLILLGLSLFLWFTVKKEKAKRFLTLCTVLSCTCVLYGILSNTFFSRPIIPVHSELRKWIAPLSVTTYEELGQLMRVMIISIWMGAIHIAWVNILRARHRRILAPYGWVVALAGVLLVTRSLMNVGYAFIGAGVAWNVVWSGLEAGRGFGRRLGASLTGLQGVIQMFADVLSYQRLFALAMAGVYMGTTFNMLSGKVWKGAPLLVGILVCPVILVLGHTVNLGLSIMGGVVHGLRLNFVESYHWYFEGGGKPFSPFRRLRTTS